jgi:precorrin-2 dehydrogenase / sirohydrochlorin ferrochelatase
VSRSTAFETMAFGYPIALALTGRLCVVIGSGDVAERKAHSLLAAGAKVAVVAEACTEGLERLARRGEIELRRKPYAFGDLEGAFVAIAATSNSSLNAEIFREAEERHVLLNAADDVQHCHFAVPSVVRRGHFLLAVSTGGKAPALSKRLREELAQQFGSEYGVLVDLLGDIRREMIADRPVDFDLWAKRWGHALDHDLVGLVRQGRLEDAKGLVRRILVDRASHRQSEQRHDR